jgi:hypothetical protein
MRDLDLVAKFLTRTRQEKLQLAHQQALQPDDPRRQLLNIRVTAHEAELCNRILAAVRVLANDPGTFIKNYLDGEGEERE